MSRDFINELSRNLRLEELARIAGNGKGKRQQDGGREQRGKKRRRWRPLSEESAANLSCWSRRRKPTNHSRRQIIQAEIRRISAKIIHSWPYIDKKTTQRDLGEQLCRLSFRRQKLIHSLSACCCLLLLLRPLAMKYPKMVFFFFPLSLLFSSL